MNGRSFFMNSSLCVSLVHHLPAHFSLPAAGRGWLAAP